jgi:hypothetical protein
MTTKTTRRNIEVVSKEEWKALVKAQELNRTQLLRSGMGTGTGTGSYGQYSNADLQGNSIYGSNAGCYAYHNDTASTVLHGIGFSIDGSAIDEEGDPVHFSYAQTTRDVRLSCRAYFDETGQLRIEPEIEVIYY